VSYYVGDPGLFSFIKRISFKKLARFAVKNPLVKLAAGFIPGASAGLQVLNAVAPRARPVRGTVTLPGLAAGTPGHLAARHRVLSRGGVRRRRRTRRRF
jgi:hypothetical protein